MEILFTGQSDSLISTNRWSAKNLCHLPVSVPSRMTPIRVIIQGESEETSILDHGVAVPFF